MWCFTNSRLCSSGITQHRAKCVCDENAIAPSILAESNNARKGGALNINFSVDLAFCHTNKIERTTAFPAFFHRHYFYQYRKLRHNRQRKKIVQEKGPCKGHAITETLPNFAYPILLYTESQTAGHALLNTDARLATGTCKVQYKQWICVQFCSACPKHILPTK